MAWNMSGHYMEGCSCKSVCPCKFGPAEPDQGWCSGSFVFDIQDGSSDGVSLSGTKVAWSIDLPGDFAGGNGAARLYIDDAVGADQRRELEAIFQGKQGGNLEALGGLIARWLPTETASIDIQGGDEPSFSVRGVGQLNIQPVRDEAGRPARLVNAPLLAAFGDSQDVAGADGGWSDPEMRQWQSGGAGGTAAFSWSA